MSAINATTVDRDLQLREKIEEISCECAKIYDELVKTIDKSNRVAHIVLDASGLIKWRIHGQGTLLTQVTETTTVKPDESEPNLSSKISAMCIRLLKKYYLPHSKAKVAEDVVDAEFTFTVEFRDANYNLIKDRVWKLAR